MPRRLVGLDPAFIAGFDDLYEEDERVLYAENHDEEEYEEEEEEEDSEEETDGGEEEEQDTSRLMPRRVLSDNGGATTSSQDVVITGQGYDSITETTAEDGGGQAAKPVEKLVVINSEKEDGGGGGGEEWSRGDIDGLFCPICMEAWSSAGNHQICCLPCGHIYGMSCIKKWLQQRKSSGKCPQCNKKCTMKDVRLLYASQLHVVDEELQKKILSLEAKCASLEKKCSDWCKKEVEWQKKEANLQMQVCQLKERTDLDYLPRDKRSRPSEFYTSGHSCNYDRHGYFNGFSLKEEMKIDGARFFDVDVSGQILIIARRLPGMGGIHVLTKMSLLSHHEKEDIQLPPNIKAVKDLRISPHNRLVLVASLGKKLSVLSTESNNTVLTYDLPAAAWSCSWDVNNSYYVYAGLQNGMVLEFDRRQTVKPVESMNGLAVKPIHTVHSVLNNPVTGSGLRRSILTASSVGLCYWNFGCNEERPHLIPESEDQGICISLAYAPRTNDIVASFRPKVEMSGDIAAATQTMLSPSASLTEPAIQGSHVVYKVEGSGYHKVGACYANVSGIRFPKSTIIERDGKKPIFAYGDEASCELVLQELPSLKDVFRLQAPRNPIRDVKYTHAFNSGLLSCLRQDTMQFISINGS